jgi:hypothetical protein
MTRVVDRCDSCKAPIYWARTEANRDMPLDAEPVEDGTFAFFDETNRIRYIKPSARRDDSPLYKSHFATCPEGPGWRKSRRRTNA